MEVLTPPGHPPPHPPAAGAASGLRPASAGALGGAPAGGPLEGVIGSRSLSRLVAFLVGAAGLTGLADAIAVGVGRSPTGYHAIVVGSVAAVAVLAAVVLAVRPALLSARAAPVLIGLAMAGVAIVAAGAGANSAPFATLFFLWAGVAFVFLPRRWAVVEVALTGVLHAVVLVIQPGHVSAFSEWLFTFGVTALTALVVSRIVATLIALARGEQEARAETEAGRAVVEEVSKHASNFLARTSHEVRTSLNAIIGLADMLGDGLVGPLNAKQADYVHEVQTSGRHLLDLIGDIMNLGEVEAGRDRLELVPFPLTDVVSGAVVLFRPEAERRGIRLSLATGRRAGTVVGDERKIRQIVLNLLSNAIKFTPSGGTVIVTVDADDRRATVAVSDSGRGVAPADTDRIFEEYSQAPGADPQVAGTGLGLPLARRFAELHDGTLGLDSRVGWGSTFTLRLPVHGPVVTAADGSTTGASPMPSARSWRAWWPFDTEMPPQILSLPAIWAFGAAGLGLATLVVNGVHPPRTALGAHPVPLLVLAAVAVCVGVASRRPGALTPARISAMLVAGTIGFTAGDYFVGIHEQPYGAMLYVWIGIGAVSFLGRTKAIAHVALVGVAYAVLLGLQSGNEDPGARWLTVMTVVVLSAIGVDWLLQRVAAQARAERRARLHAEQVRAELEEANRHKSAFLATLSHELRTPLNAIIGFSEVLADELFGPLSDKQREYADDLKGAGHQLLALVNDVLELAKIDAGRMDLDLEAGVDVADVMAGVCAEAGSAVQVEVLGGTPAVIADRRKLHRMVSGLVAEMVEAPRAPGPVFVVARGSDGELEIDIRAPGGGDIGEPVRRERRDLPLRVSVAAALAEMHGGEVLAFAADRGWRLRIPPTPQEPEELPPSRDVAAREKVLIERSAAADRAAEIDAAALDDQRYELIGELEIAKTGLRLGGAVASMSMLAVGVMLVGPRKDWVPGFHPVVLIAFAFAWLAMVLGGRKYPVVFSPRHLPAVLAGGVVSLTVEIWCYGPVIGPYVAMSYVWLGMVAQQLFRRSAALATIGGIGVAYAVLLAIQPGNSAPVTRWIVVIGLTLVAGELAWQLTDRIRRLAAGERRVRAELELGRRRLEVTNRQRAEFLAGMSHELRTPLNAIIGFADVLDERLFGPLSATQEHQVARVRDAGRTLLGLVDEVLDADSAQAGAGPAATESDLASIDRSPRLDADQRGPLAFLIVVGLAIATFPHHAVPEFQTRPIVIAGLVTPLLDAFILFVPGIRPLARAALHIALVAAAALAIAWYAGAHLAAYALMAVVAMASIAAVRLPRRGALGYLGVVAAGTGLLVAFQHGNGQAFVRWEMVVGTCITSAATIRTIVNRSFDLADKEARTRQVADQAWSELELASRHKIEFLRKVRRELRQPIDAVTAAATQLVAADGGSGELAPKQAEYAADIASAAEHLWTLVGDILDLATLEEGRMVLVPRDVDLTPVVASAAGAFQTVARAGGLTLKINVDPAGGQAWVDAEKLRRAISGLVSNAIKFTPPGGTVVVAAVAGPDGATIEVSDTGPGIPLEDRERIFEGFQQGGPAHAAPGTGVGLTLAKRFVELQGGTLLLETAQGSGSTFTIHIPGRRAERGVEAGATTLGG